MNNRSILNGGVRARMRLHSSDSLAPSMCRLTNIHLSSNYNSGNSQTNSNAANIGSSTTIISSVDGTSSNNVSSSSSSLSANTLMNGHAIPIVDKSMMSPGNRHAADIRTFAGRLTIKDQSPASVNSPEGRVYRRGSYGNPVEQQSAMAKLDLRSMPRSEQSSSMISGQQTCAADVRGILRQDQPMDSLGAAQTDLNVSLHADARGSGALRIEQPTSPDGRVITRTEHALRIEQPVVGTRTPEHTLRIEQPTIVTTLPDGRVLTRSEQSTNGNLTDDLRETRQPIEQSTNIRRMSTTNEDLRTVRQPEQSIASSTRVSEDIRGMRQQTEQSANNIRLNEDARGMRQSEQSVRMVEDLRATRQQPTEQSTSVRLQEDLRIPRAEQSLNADLRGVSRGAGPQNTNILPTDGHRTASSVSRSEQSAMFSLPDGRTISIAEHMSSPAVLPDPRSGTSRIPQTAVSLPNQSIAVPATAQSGSSVLLTEDVSHSEEPLPPGWEMRYDLYGRR